MSIHRSPYPPHEASSAPRREAARPIVVGDDGTARGRDAIAVGRLLADLSGAPIQVVTVHPYTPLSSRMEHDGWTSMTAASARQALERARRELAGRDDVDFRRVAASAPVLGLDLAAEEAEAQMIVVGSTGRGAVGRLLPGTTAEQLFAHARLPVAVAPAGYAERLRSRTLRIGVGYDDERESRDALTVATALAVRAGTPLRLIGVFDPAACGTPGVRRMYGEPADREEARDRAFARLERAAAGVPGAQSRFLEGRPAVRLAEASNDVDLMVVGSHRRGALRRALLGSVSSELVEHTRCPVVVVPRRSAHHPRSSSFR